MKKLPIVLMDLDDTILDFKHDEARSIKKSFTELNIPVSDEIISLYSRINISWWEKLEEGTATREEVLVRRFDELFETLGIEASGQLAQELYERELHNGHFFIEGAEALLEELKGKYRLFICSNGVASVQDARIGSAGIAHYFENIFISQRIGANKPSAEFFRRCFELIPDFEPERAIMVGDSLTSDIRGGLNAGILTCRFNPNALPGREDIKPHYEISSLSQLAPLLAELW